LVFLAFGSAGLTINFLRVLCLLGNGTFLTRRKLRGIRFQPFRAVHVHPTLRLAPRVMFPCSLA
jgi:hypothetical protein